jgi:2-polyprenyl-6-methoxyphenol hydroxylase-like FAD-dependent oxidoreductase
MRVLISGAGIAGPALAYWLRRYGFEVTVVEVAPAPRPGGQAVDIRGVARDVVERMGLMPAVRAKCIDERGFAYVDRRGRLKSRMPADLFGGEGIVADLEIMRGDLSAVLLEATREDVDYRFGERIVGIDGTQVRLTRSTETFDVIVGADGVHSGVRALAFGPDQDFVHDLGASTAYFTVPDPGDLDHWFHMYGAPGRRNAAIRPERDGLAKAMLSVAAPVKDRRDLAAAFAGVGWRVPAMLDAMWDADDFVLDSIAQVKVDRWWRGRVVLLGDAAYCGSPLSGLGTSTSIVGAYVLAGELASSGPEQGFARYQEAMRAYVTEAQKLPPGGVNGFLPKTRVMITLRNLSMRMMTRWPMRGLLEKQFQKADAIELKNYEILPVPAPAVTTLMTDDVAVRLKE